MTDRFTICLPYTLAQECPKPDDWSNPHNFSNDRGDPGGATMCGITHREYNAWRKSLGLPVRDVRVMTQVEGTAIYLAYFWNPDCSKLPPGLDLQFFDTAVNQGQSEAVRILQVALDIENDGLWGPQTDGAVQALATPALVAGALRRFTARRQAVYRQTNGFNRFGTDWLRRNKEIGAAALKMVAA